MITEKNKATRIMKEIVGYFLHEHLYQFDIHFDINESRFTMEISANTNQKPNTFDRFIEDLKLAREIEVDEYFNSLLGSHTEHEDYQFLGKTIDEAEGAFENGKLTVKITRNVIN